MTKQIWGVALLSCLLVACSKSPINYSQHSESDLVIVIHGLSKSGRSMSDLNQALLDSAYQTCVLDYSSIGVTMDELLSQSNKQINQCIQDATRVHFVGHSLGGLLTRYYLQTHKTLEQQNRLGKVVMIGTPNQGSAVADKFSDKWWANWVGEVPSALVSQKHGFVQTLEYPPYDVGIIVGTSTYPFTSHLFDEPNDGLVSVASAKIDGKDNVWEVDTTHDRLRSDPRVFKQVISYLEDGRFN